MEKLKPIGYAHFNEKNQTSEITIDENLVKNLAELSDYTYIALLISPPDTPTFEEQKLIEIFGEKAREIKKAKLISVINNVITVEKLTHKSLDTPLEIEDIKYLPGYTDSMSDEDDENMNVEAGENPKPTIWLDLIPENGIRCAV